MCLLLIGPCVCVCVCGSPCTVCVTYYAICLQEVPRVVKSSRPSDYICLLRWQINPVNNDLSLKPKASHFFTISRWLIALIFSHRERQKKNGIRYRSNEVSPCQIFQNHNSLRTAAPPQHVRTLAPAYPPSRSVSPWKLVKVEETLKSCIVILEKENLYPASRP